MLSTSNDDVAFAFCLQNPFRFPFADGRSSEGNDNESSDDSSASSSKNTRRTLSQATVSHNERDFANTVSVNGKVETFFPDVMFALTDDEAVKQLSSTSTSSSTHLPQTTAACPTNFQKMIELILRLEKRGCIVEPKGMLISSSSSATSHRSTNSNKNNNNIDDDNLDDVLQPTPSTSAAANNDPLNQFHGYSLDPAKLLTSPDQDEVLFQCIAPEAVLLAFAMQHGLVLATHPFSFACGQAMPYDSKLEVKLSQSVERYYRLYPNSPAPPSGEGDHVQPPNNLHRGFLITACDKMRLTHRLLDEDWLFGGCGLPIAEMKRKQVFVKQLMPLHNATHAASLDLTKWSSFGVLLTAEPLFYEEPKVMQYFGEEVTLYFSWLHSYTKFLLALAFPGCIIACLTGLTSDAVTADTLNALYAAYCILWGAWWLAYWNRQERRFAATYSQDAHVSQEIVRDDFRHTDEKVLQPEDIFEMNLRIPLTVKRKPDGSIVELKSSNRRRLLMRHLVCYPLIAVMAGAMVTAHIFNTKLRYEYPNDNLVSYGCSVLSIVISFTFAQIFDRAVPLMNKLENHRTYTEELAQWVGKSFQFYFFSNYSALFTIALWPTVQADPGKDPDRERLEQLQAQMLIIIVVKPMINNILELVKPWLKQQLRLRVDLFGSYPAALMSILKRQPLPPFSMHGGARNRTSNSRTPYNAKVPNNNDTSQSVEMLTTSSANSDNSDNNNNGEDDLQRLGRTLWSQSLLEPYESPSEDYLEITLQFGYMTMFAASFPFAAVACLFYNMLELRLDAWKLMHLHQRPTPRAANTIGSWGQIAFYLVGVAVVTNSYLCAVISDLTLSWDLGSDAEGSLRFKTFALMQYVLLLVMLVVVSIGSASNDTELIANARQWVLSNVSVRRKFLADVRATGMEVPESAMSEMTNDMDL